MTPADAPVDAGPQAPAVAVAIAAGSYHACALMSDGSARCWGCNGYGELGRVDDLGGASSVPGSVEKLDHAFQLSLGNTMSSALRDDATAWCWGSGPFGNGELESSFAVWPVQVEITDVAQIAQGFVVRRDASLWYWAEWWPPDPLAYPFQATPVPAPLADPVYVLAQAYARCLIGLDATAMCRGYNDYGQVGDGTTDHRVNFTPVIGLGDLAAISASFDHACALGVDGTVHCWGEGKELGVGIDSDSPVPVPVKLPSSARLIASGVIGSSCAVLQDGRVSCWGGNLWGQLGDGTSDTRLVPTPVVGLEDVQSVVLGVDFGCALLEDKSVWCWGSNNNGQLGDGTRKQSYVPVRVKLEGEDADAG